MSTGNSPSEVCASIRIAGMTCASCELLLERKLSALPGMIGVDVDHRTGRAELRARAEACPSLEKITHVIQHAGYRIVEEGGSDETSGEVSGPSKWKEIGASLIIIFAIYKLLQTFDIVSLAPSTTGVVSIGGIFLIGIIAGTSSCLAVTGGLLLAASAKYNEVNASLTPWQKFKPLLSFNIGRLISYFVLGGVVGLLGQAITLSPKVTGVMNIMIALIMFYLALSILQIIPKGSFPIRPPKRLSHWIANLSENPHPAAPFFLGALTFLLPCGFTQSLQLAALASGNFVTGAMTMGVFALGTLPALLGISAISSVAKGSTFRLFLRFSGTLVLVLSVFNLNSALALTGIDLSSFLASARNSGTASDQPVIKDGVQEVRMKVSGYGYEPSRLTIKAGIPVRWIVDGTDAGGCTSGIVIPSLNIMRVLESGDNVIEFTAPSKLGRLGFSCSMGMVRGSFNVI